MMHHRGMMSPWAEDALAVATGSREAERVVRASRIARLAGRSPRGPWIAGVIEPRLRVEGWDIVAVINEAAGEQIVANGDG